MKTPELVHVCLVKEIPGGEARPFHVEGYDIAIFNTGDDVYAIENRCPHMGAELSDGELVSNSVCCGDHGWIIDLQTGEVKNREGIQVATFPIVVENGEVFIQLG
jgi:nitrite reductase/ring-hydroxylating ferredoxin subunit